MSVQAVNNRVWRIAIVDKSESDEANIKVRFNNLFEQFSSNGKYVAVSGDKLTDADKISYEMNVHNKRYEAIFGFIDESINGYV